MRKTTYAVILLCIVLSGCAKSPEKPFPEEQSQEIAEQHVLGMYQYTEYNGRNLQFLGARPAGCDGCYTYTFEFDLDSEKLPSVVDRATVAVTVQKGQITDTVFTEGSSDRMFGFFLNESLFLSDEDIAWYDRNTHEFRLTDSGVEKMKSLHVPLSGIFFTVRLDERTIYNGTFWTPISSLSSSTPITINVIGETDTLKVWLSPDYTGRDMRNDGQLLSYFSADNRLRATEGENYCTSSGDCACGTNAQTGECFFGNRKYVSIGKQCPDFCTGIAGNLRILCINNECIQKACDPCPLYTPYPPGWCSDGKVMPGSVDDCGCRQPPSCVHDAAIPDGS